MPRLLLTNVRSLIPKIDELEVVANVNEADIICITETWLTPDIPDSALSYFVMTAQYRLEVESVSS